MAPRTGSPPGRCSPTFPPDLRCRILAERARRPAVDVNQEAEMLRHVPLFGGLSPKELKLLAFTGSVLKFDAGEDLMRQGERADSAFVILDGEVEVLVETRH